MGSLLAVELRGAGPPPQRCTGKPVPVLVVRKLTPNAVVRVAEWLSHSTVVHMQEVPGSNPGDAESVGQ